MGPVGFIPLAPKGNMLWIIILGIFIVPIASIVTIKGTIVWYPQLLALQLIGGICYASNFWKLNKFIAIFLGYLVFSYIYVTSANPRTLLCLMIGYGAIAITLAVSKLKDLKWIYIALISMSLLSIAYSILQKFGIDPIFIPADHSMKADIVSFMGSHNQLGIYSAANAFWSPYLMPLSIIPLFLSKSNSAMIGLVVGCLFYVCLRYGKKYLYIGIIFVLVTMGIWWHFCGKSNGEIMERFNLWKLTIQQIKQGRVEISDLDNHKAVITDNKLFGFGLGSFFSYSPFSQYKMWGLTRTDHACATRDGSLLQPHFYEHAHNDLLEADYEFGPIGFLLIVFIIFSVVMLFASSIKSVGVITTFASLIAQSVSSFSVYVFHAPVSLFMFCLTLGLFYAEVGKNAKPS
jgi:hypothetical protein